MFPTLPKFRKLELLMKNEVLTRSEIRQYHGQLLTDVFCDFGNPEVKRFLGIIPPLKGPQSDLWISPSDQLIGKVCLRPPLTDKHIKACTHDGILELGEKAVQKYEKEIEEKLRELWKGELKEARLMFEAEKRHEMKLLVKELEEKFNRQMIRSSKEHEKQLHDVLTEAVAKSDKQLQKAVVETRMNVTHEMMKKLRDEIGYVVSDLHNEFQRKLRSQRDNFVADFNKIMRIERGKAEDRIREFEDLKSEDMEVLRVEMENKKSEDINRVIQCQERQCEIEKQKIRQNYEKKLLALEKNLAEAKKSIECLENERKKELPPNDDLWREKIRKIFREFQKFIDFYFKSVPGQTEFLLSLESFLELESDKDPSNNDSKSVIFSET